MDDLVRRRLAALKDPREVIADPKALYSGAKISERTLVPNKNARLGETRFETWLKQSSAKFRVLTRRVEKASVSESVFYEAHKNNFGAGMSRNCLAGAPAGQGRGGFAGQLGPHTSPPMHMGSIMC